MQKVMFSNESTFWLVRGHSKGVRKPSNVSTYDPRYNVKMVKQPDSVMKMKMKATNYIEVSEEHMLTFWSIHEAEYSMHDLAPAHKSKASSFKKGFV
ncbi:hypothetical protein E2C01_032988 [Portunus trituberculatus]|uniref:Uncharacterized protein n=1 Tax=Portunus trituberculatus TaxID=210409 RepID=A0A5B7EXD6_PORTR|nr:hypothetical protein [Portunus trituberculatus]